MKTFGGLWQCTMGCLLPIILLAAAVVRTAMTDIERRERGFRFLNVTIKAMSFTITFVITFLFSVVIDSVSYSPLGAIVSASVSVILDYLPGKLILLKAPFEIEWNSGSDPILLLTFCAFLFTSVFCLPTKSIIIYWQQRKKENDSGQLKQ